MGKNKRVKAESMIGKTYRAEYIYMNEILFRENTVITIDEYGKHMVILNIYNNKKYIGHASIGKNQDVYIYITENKNCIKLKF